MTKPKYSLVCNKITGEKAVRINKTAELVLESVNPTRYADLHKKALNNANKRAYNDALSSLGLTRVVGSISGRTYWE